MYKNNLIKVGSGLIGLLAVFVSYLSLMSDSKYSPAPWLLTIILGLLVSFLGGVAADLFRNNPTTLTISLLGFPGSGKTVYLTALFDVLQQHHQRDKIKFAPYGSETVEAVTRNLNTLSKGIWLPRTSVYDVFYYRAHATIFGALTRSSFKIEIGDFAGESMGELDPSSEMWLHKSNYFKYVVQSDAVMLAIDSEILLHGDRHQVEEMQNSFVAALQILAESKGATESKKLKAPVALLFFKVDLLTGSLRDVPPLPKEIRDKLHTLPARVSRLISVCEARCRNFEFFYVSSVGHTIVDPKGEYPPSKLQPFGVVEPLVWILKNVNKAS